MAISYKPLWKLLIDKDFTKKQLKEVVGISGPTIARMGKNEYVSLEIIERICIYFNCSISEVVEYFPDEEKK